MAEFRRVIEAELFLEVYQTFLNLSGPSNQLITRSFYRLTLPDKIIVFNNYRFFNLYSETLKIVLVIIIDTGGFMVEVSVVLVVVWVLLGVVFYS